MPTGKLNLSFHPTHSWSQRELSASPMVTLTVPDAQPQSAPKSARRACLTAKLIETMFAGILAPRMAAGSKECTLEFIETLGPLKRLDSLWVLTLALIQKMLGCQTTAVDYTPLSNKYIITNVTSV